MTDPLDDPHSDAFLLSAQPFTNDAPDPWWLWPLLILAFLVWPPILIAYIIFDQGAP